MARPAIAVIAGRDVRRRGAALVVVGLLAGLFGGLVVAGAALVRRSVTAPDRLLAESRAGDAHVRFFRSELAGEVAALPMVTGATMRGVVVGRLEEFGSVQYLGVAAPMSTAEPLLQPVIVRGRAAAPGDPTEVVIVEDRAREGGFAIGDVLRLAMLTPEEMLQFDTGFGDPDGPTVELTVTGVVRVPPGTYAGTLVLATPAFATEHASLFSGIDAAFSLQRGRADFAAFAAAVSTLAGAQAPSPDDDFAAATVLDPTEGTAALEDSATVLVVGLVAAVVAAGVAVVVALGQAWARHHGASAAEQGIERALGLTSIERVGARTLPALLASGVAACVAVAVALVGGRLEPPGALGTVEPHPGWRPDVLVAVLGGIAVAVIVAYTATLAAWTAGRPSTMTMVPRRSPIGRSLPQRRGWPLAGAVFALRPARGVRRAPMRTSVVAGVLGVAGIVGALTFSASLDRLAAEPRRYGWASDLVVVDVTDDVVAELVADDRFVAVTEATSASVAVDGRDVDAYAYEARLGTIEWTLLAGRMPRAADELLAGTKLADRLGVGVGEQVTIGDPAAGTAVTAMVVGVGVGPPVNGEAFAVHALFTTEGLARARSVGNFREAFVRVAPGVDAAAIAAELGVRYELGVRAMPPAVRDVVDLGSLPLLLGGFLAALAVVAHVHGLTVTVRERREDLAVLRALGSTRRQLQMTTIAVSLAPAAIGVVVGVPLGWAVGRLLWGSVASSLGVARDVRAPWTILLAAGAALVIAVVAALVPAGRAARVSSSEVRRGE